MSQPTLFKPPPADGNLTARQQAVLDLLRQHPAGCDDVALGLAAHAAAGCAYCGLTSPCKYATSDGRAIAVRLKKLGLTRYRRKTGRWHATSRVQHPQDDIPY